MSSSEQSYIQTWLNRLYPNVISQLPGLLADGGFDPYGGPDKKGFSWDVGAIPGQAGTTAAQLVCGRVGAAKWPQQLWIPTQIGGAASPPSIGLSGSFVSGLSQLVIPPFNSANPSASGLYAPLDQDRVIVINGQLSDPDKPLTIYGTFAFAQDCCQQGVNPQTCSDTAPPIPTLHASGTYSATINSATVQVTLQITTLSTNQLTVAATSVNLSIAPTTDNMKISINITSVSDGHVADYDESAEQLFNQDATIGTIVRELQQTLLLPSNLTGFSSQMTSQVDAYLQSHSYYPYGPPFLGLV